VIAATATRAQFGQQAGAGHAYALFGTGTGD
jgi:hypothetical protein